jgi:EpsI family protein
MRMNTDFGSVPVRRLYATNSARHEPITYWITVGDKATESGAKAKLAQLRYGLSGTVPDGILVRVSSIDTDTAAAYTLQQKFVSELLRALTPQARKRLIGVIDA